MSLFTGRRSPESLDALFAPRSIAVVGASSDPRKIGGRPIAFLKRDGFAGAILPINPQHAEVQGLRAYPSLAELPEAPDLVLIALPASRTTEAVAAAAARGVKVAVLFSSGFAEAGEEGHARQAQLAATIGDSPMRLLGPNCIGAASIANGAYATFAVALETGAPPAGGVGIVSQSGALASHLHVLARMTHLGVSRWIATGNEVDIDVADGIAWLAGDAATRVIICTLESGRDGARLRAALEMARAASKPVFVLRMGGSAIGRAAAASHTGALAGDDAIFDAVLRQGGAVRVNSIEALLDAAYVAETALARKVSRERMARARLGVVTLSGGVGVLLADVAERLDLPMPALHDDAQRAILELVPFGAARNPIDPTAQVNVAPDLMEKTLDIAMAAGDFDALIVFVSGVPYSADLGAIYLDALRKIRARYRNRLVIVSALAPPAYRRRVERAGMVYFEDPTRACVALAALRSVARGWATRRSPVEVERATTPPWNGLRLDELEAKRILAAAGIPIARERLVDSVESAVTAAQAVGFPIALKIVSPDIAHKTEVGGVRLNLTDDQSVAAAYRELVASVATKASGAQIRGVAVAHMERGIETILGVTRDPTFGPVVMFGLGGIFVETLRDVTFRVAPFDRAEALTMIGEIKGYAILTGTRGHPPADIDALADALVKLAQFAAAHADSISSIDINPFIVRAKGQGAVAVDALIVPTPSPRTGDTARSA